MPNMIELMVVVHRFVRNNGMFSRMKPCIAKHSPPIAIKRNVPTAMSSVERVRMVRMVCGRYPNTIAIHAEYPIIIVNNSFAGVVFQKFVISVIIYMVIIFI